jgi:hypothetical protein
MPAEGNDGSAPKKPSLLRQVIPWLFAAGILAFMFYKVNFTKVWGVMSEARASWIIAAYLTYCAIYYLTDILSFWRAYNWFNAEIGFRETARLRLASYAVQAINGALTEIMSVLYMFRVKKVPVLQSTSSAGFVYYNETLTLVALLTFCAFFLPEENRITITVPGINASFWTLFQGLMVLAWALVPAWLLFWRTSLCDRLPRIRDAGALTAFKQGTLLNYGEVFFYRFANNLVSVAANIIILKALGIEAPLALLFAAVPVMVNVAYWPVSAGGFGGPQLAAHFLLKGYATEEAILAYSLTWSALFFLTRTLTGVPFIAPVYRAAFPAKNTGVN